MQSKLGDSANKGNLQVLNPGTHAPIPPTSPHSQPGPPQGILIQEPFHPIPPKNMYQLVKGQPSTLFFHIGRESPPQRGTVHQSCKGRTCCRGKGVDIPAAAPSGVCLVTPTLSITRDQVCKPFVDRENPMQLGVLNVLTRGLVNPLQVRSPRPRDGK